MPVLNRTPILKHGTNCSFVKYTCNRCSVGYSVCTTYRCYSSTVGWHNDTSCTSCGAACPI